MAHSFLLTLSRRRHRNRFPQFERAKLRSDEASRTATAVAPLADVSALAPVRRARSPEHTPVEKDNALSAISFAALALMVEAPDTPNASVSKLPEPPIIGRQASTLVSPTAPDADAGQDVIVVEALRHAPADDPLEHVNETSFEATQAVDHALVGPVAMGYKHAIPEPVRNGLRNVLNNLHEPVVLLNFLVQMKPGKASETLGRFTINSTLGAAGLFDMAKRPAFNLPRRPNGFADSLGYYGVKPGPYLFLPLVGPTTLRDLVGGGVDRLVLPLGIGKPFTQPAYTLPTAIVSALNRRVEIDENLRHLREQAPDPYPALRRFYLQKRQDEIDDLRGRVHSAD